MPKKRRTWWRVVLKEITIVWFFYFLNMVTVTYPRSCGDYNSSARKEGAKIMSQIIRHSSPKTGFDYNVCTVRSSPVFRPSEKNSDG